MKLTSYGAALEVTGSQHLLEVNGKRILLDCGLFQGHRQIAFEKNQDFKFDPTTVDAVLVSHAHIDHTGNLPHLVKKGFVGHIYGTEATKKQRLHPKTGYGIFQSTGQRYGVKNGSHL